MKIYIASSFSLIKKVDEVTKSIEEAGHEITVKWWQRAYQSKGLGLIGTQELKKLYANLPVEEFYQRPETKKSYLADLEGIEIAEVFLLVAPDVASRSALVGANVELGYALALGLECFSIGELMNSAMYWGVTRCKDIQSFVNMLNKWEEYKNG